jgi:hypothetical protein
MRGEIAVGNGSCGMGLALPQLGRHDERDQVTARVRRVGSGVVR